MDSIKKTDIEFGLSKEIENLEIIKNMFDCGLKKISDNYYCFDFTSDSCYVELKSRRCNHTQYKDTMIGKNKLDYASKSGKPVYFVFGFNDGLYYWKYNSEDLTNGNVEIRDGGRKDRGCDEIKKYGFIKTEILKKV
jgi:hypothetical protein